MVVCVCGLIPNILFAHNHLFCILPDNNNPLELPSSKTLDVPVYDESFVGNDVVDPVFSPIRILDEIVLDAPALLPTRILQYKLC